VRDGGHIGLPAEAAQHHALAIGIPDIVGLALDGAAQGRLGRGVGQDIGFRDVLQQAQADDLGCDARAGHQIRRQGAVVEPGQLIDGLFQRVGRAIGKAALHLLVADAQLAFALDAQHAFRIELVAIDRVRQRAAVRPLARNGQPHEQACKRLGLERVVEVGRLGAAVLHMAAAAGPRQEVRAQAVARRGGGWGLHPVALEEGVADDEARALGIFQIGRRQREGVAARGVDRGLAARGQRRVRRGEQQGRVGGRRGCWHARRNGSHRVLVLGRAAQQAQGGDCQQRRGNFHGGDAPGNAMAAEPLRGRRPWHMGVGMDGRRRGYSFSWPWGPPG
jgi:hypothetical protein